jgi:hypothetical protein
MRSLAEAAIAPFAIRTSIYLNTLVADRPLADRGHRPYPPRQTIIDVNGSTEEADVIHPASCPSLATECHSERPLRYSRCASLDPRSSNLAQDVTKLNITYLLEEVKKL